MRLQYIQLLRQKKYQINHLLYMKEKMKLLNLNREVKEQN
jgi:hypothetical protein